MPRLEQLRLFDVPEKKNNRMAFQRFGGYAKKKSERAMRAIGMSDAAITHCAGDSIVVDVLMDIFNEMISKKGIQR